MLKSILTGCITATLALSAHAEWNPQDDYLIDASTDKVLANIVKANYGADPIVHLDSTNQDLRMYSQSIALPPITLWFSEPNCEGYAYVNETDIPNVGYEVYVGTANKDNQLYLMTAIQGIVPTAAKSMIPAGSKNCEPKSEYIQAATAGYYVPQYPQELELIETSEGTIAQFVGVNAYATTNGFPIKGKQLDIHFNERGNVSYVLNQTDLPMTAKDLIVEHELDSGYYDVIVSKDVLPAELEPDKVSTQCSVNIGNYTQISNYKVGCYKVNGQNRVRVITHTVDEGASPDTPISVSIKW